MTSENINTLTAKGTWFVKMYAPWCQACKQLAPAWRELGNTMESDPKYHVGELDCTKNMDACEELGVKSYPVRQMSSSELRLGVGSLTQISLSGLFLFLLDA